MNSNINIMVTVCIFTYNQQKWIRDAIESVLAQKTDYNFEIIIGEDCGSDDTRKICEEYAQKHTNIKLLPSDRNHGVASNWIRCVEAGTGKYIMTCAGDDYWHNPQKIQLQVDFMEQHPMCVMSFTDLNKFYEKSGKLERNVIESNGIVPAQGRIQKDLLHGSTGISAVTTCIRRDMFEKYVPIEKYAKFPREDWPTWIILSAHGDILYIPISTATYRVGQESITRTSDYDTILSRARQDKEMTRYLYSLFPELGPFADEEYFNNIGIHVALNAAYRNNDYAAAKRFAQEDKLPTWATRMARTKLTFKLFRLMRLRRYEK